MSQSSIAGTAKDYSKEMAQNPLLESWVKYVRSSYAQKIEDAQLKNDEVKVQGLTRIMSKEVDEVAEKVLAGEITDMPPEIVQTVSTAENLSAVAVANQLKTESTPEFNSVARPTPTTLKSNNDSAIDFERTIQSPQHQPQPESDKAQKRVNLKYPQDLSQVPFAQVIYSGDAKGLSQLLSSQSLQNVVNRLAPDEKYQARRDLLKKSFHLTPNSAPQVYQIGKTCQEKLGLGVNLDFYVHSDASFKAYASAPRGKTLPIILTSGLIEKFTPQEIEFLIGHEIGHFLFNHFHFPVNVILRKGHTTLSPMVALKLHSWKRNADISADRVGLICCGQFEVASSALLKVSSGVTNDALNIKGTDYIHQMGDITKSMLGQEQKHSNQDFYTHHPFNPLRIKALHLYSESQAFQQISETGSGSLSFEDVEKQIFSFMSLMEPNYTMSNSEFTAENYKLIYFVGYAIAAADGTVEDSELKALGKLVPQDVAEACFKEVQNVNLKILMTMIKDQVSKVQMHLPPIKVHQMVRDLAVIIYADGHVDLREKQVLYHFCHQMKVPPEFVDRVLYDADQLLD